MSPEIGKVNWIYFREQIYDFETSLTALVEVLQYKFFDQQSPCDPTLLHCEFIGESEKKTHRDLAKISISYLGQDKVVVDKICGTLMQNSHTLWKRITDIKNSDTAYSKNLERIGKSDNFIYIFSRKSLENSSDQELWEQELKYA